MQSAKPEIIVSQQPIEPKINKNRLLNEGFKKAKGDIIFHCDADFQLKDNKLLENAEKRLKETTYPVFRSSIDFKYKIADGGAFVRREVLERHGPLDESLTGIGYVTFPFLLWCIENTDFNIHRNFEIIHGCATVRRRVDHETKNRLKPVYDKVRKHPKYRRIDA